MKSENMLKIHVLHLRFANAYLIESASGLYLVDTGMPGDERHILNKMAALDRDDLRLIFLTHAHIDHVGSATAVRAQTGAPIAIHRADAAALEDGRTELGDVRGRGRLIKWCLPLIETVFPSGGIKADVLLCDGDELKDYGLDARVLHTPGHTTGSSSLLVGKRHLFVGDLLSTNAGPHCQKYYASDWSQVEDSIELLRSQPAEIIYPGHGKQIMSMETLKILPTAQDLIES